MRQWPKPLRWGIALAVTIVVSAILAIYANVLPFGQSVAGSLFRGVMAGATFVLMMRLLALNRGAEEPGDD
jgi:hypothetical protein